MTPAALLLARCRALDVRLRVESGRLRFSAPRGALDPDLWAELAARKVELIALLSTPPAASTAAASAASAQPDPALWRRVLPTWPIYWRERWGERANELHSSGVPWPHDEAQAFAEVAAELGGDAPPE
jgi:hypothetical protein